MRLFCSSCCLEFGTTAELNKHMEMHNNSVPAVAAAGGGKNQKNIWNQQEYDSTGADYSNQQANAENMAVGNAGYTSEQTQVMDATNNVSVENALPAEMSGMISNTTNNSSKKQNEPMENCLQCSMTFASGVDMKKHIDLAHSGRQENATFACRFCSQEFADKSALREHAAEHSKLKPYQCGECGARLANQVGLTRHVKRVHERQQPFQCEDCGKRFYEKHDLQRHLRTHEKASLVEDCAKCLKSFSSQYQKDKHKCKGPEGRFPCEICDSKLDSKAAWGYHMWRHTKDSKYIDANSALEQLREQQQQKNKLSGENSNKTGGINVDKRQGVAAGV